MSIFAGLFVLSIAFMKDIVGEESVTNSQYLIWSWLTLIISLISGIFHMKCWDRFYIAYRKPNEECKQRRKKINQIRVTVESVQIISFVVGVVLMFVFSAQNF